MKKINREDWANISLCIAQGLKESRKIWFNSCVQILGNLKESEEVVNSELGGEAELAIKTWQLYQASGFLPAYISESDGRDFADILYAQVCGTELLECMSYLKRYREVEDNSTILFRFCSDVAKYITGNSTPLISSDLPPKKWTLQRVCGIIPMGS